MRSEYQEYDLSEYQEGDFTNQNVPFHEYIPYHFGEDSGKMCCEIFNALPHRFPMKPLFEVDTRFSANV